MLTMAREVYKLLDTYLIILSHISEPKNSITTVQRCKVFKDFFGGNST